MATSVRYLVSVAATIATTIGLPAAVIAAEETRRKIEEIVVTAEKRESTVSDTSISITAFDSEMITDLGLQGADELINYLPATTRDDFDIRIRGVGRNFRALGGDPGVATYYNGVYSPDFAIAASENALYDLERVEVLRGPQGTLYGRNSIGGALNYLTKKPTMTWQGEVRGQVGEYDTREGYGFISGPIIQDKLAARLVMNKRLRDGDQQGQNGSPDTNTIDDRNVSLALQWRPTDDIEWNIRGNDRKSSRVIPGPVFLTQGSAADRDVSSADREVLGLRPVDATYPGALQFTNPISGALVYGAPSRQGVDVVGFPYSPNSWYGTQSDNRPIGLSTKNPRDETQTNYDDNSCNDFPYTTCNDNHELFDHKSLQSSVDWDLNEDITLRYVFGYTDFDYTYNQDIDNTSVDFTKYRQTVDADVWNYSHEVQLLWALGDKFTATSGLYYFREQRNQDYSLSNTIPRFTDPVDYGNLATRYGFLGGASTLDLFCGMPQELCNQVNLGDAEMGTSIFGLYDEGNARGDIYHHQNEVNNKSYAAFTQGTYEFNEQWALTLGIRYAKDKKSAKEVRGGYFESSIPWASTWLGAIGGCFNPGTGGMTVLAATNCAMGNATASGNPDSPITPVCAIDDINCTNPLRLGAGMPISYTSSVQGNDSWDHTNFRVNIDWTPNDNTLVYLSYTTGYRAGGYQLGVTDARDTARDANGLPVAGSDLEPLTYGKETVDSVELGYKGTLLDDTLQMNLSIYHYKYDGYQDRNSVFDPVRNQAVDVVQNADGVVNQGFEAEFSWLATDNLTLNANYSYTDAHYGDDYYIIEGDNPALPPTLFGDANMAPELFVQNVKNDALKRIPEHKGTIWGSYDIPTGYGNFSLRSTYSYTGEYQNSAVKRSLDKVPAREQVDVAVIWEDMERRYTVRVFCDNVTDEQNLRGINTTDETANWALSGDILYPRYYGMDVTMRFGS